MHLLTLKIYDKDHSLFIYFLLPRKIPCRKFLGRKNAQNMSGNQTKTITVIKCKVGRHDFSVHFFKPKVWEESVIRKKLNGLILIYLIYFISFILETRQ